MNFIEHIIEPTRLLMAWQASDESHRTRYIVGELKRVGEKIDLKYLVESKDFQLAKEHGFKFYPAFPDVSQTYHDVLDSFMPRLPPRTRGDLPQYLEGLRLKPDVKLSDFGLLGYSGGKLPTDGFSFIHPFDNVDGSCELLLEAAGYRHLYKNGNANLATGEPATFAKDFYSKLEEPEIKIIVREQHIGSVNRGLIPTFINWIDSNRIAGAWIEKINGSPGKPSVYLFVNILPKNLKA